jgi:hypothetical protein
METDFGVIYERPPSHITTTREISGSALATSPEAGTSAISAVSLGGENGDLEVGIGMAPRMQETIRRKSVSSKDKQVVTIGALLQLTCGNLAGLMVIKMKFGQIGRTSSTL